MKNYEIKIRSNKNLLEELELLENLSLFLNRGYQLSEAMNLINKRFSLDKELEMLKEGKLLSEILKSRDFDNDVLLILEISEQSGNLKSGVNKSVVLLKNKIDTKDQVIEVIKYPLLLAAILILALGFVSVVLIPQFQNIYSSFGIELSIFIKTIFLTIKILPIITTILLIFIIIFIIYIKNQPFESQMQFYLKYDIIAKYYIKLYNQVFVINITNLLLMGLRLDEILLILQKQQYNELVAKEAMRILIELKQGSQLYQCLNTKLYTDELVLLIREGEQQSTLVQNLENYIIYIQKQRASKTQKMIFLIQPIFYGIFGVLIIMLYASIFLPMYQMMDAL